MKSTKAMRNRCRELSKPDRDDYDRAVICILDDLEALQARVEELEVARGIDLRECAAQLDQNTATMDVARARIEALEAALREAERFMAYFADGATSFVGPGTPTSCLAKIRAALELDQ
jgi:hypothetical protein